MNRLQPLPANVHQAYQRDWEAKVFLGFVRENFRLGHFLGVKNIVGLEDHQSVDFVFNVVGVRLGSYFIEVLEKERLVPININCFQGIG